VPAGNRVVAVNDLARDAKGVAAVRDVFLAVLRASRRRDAPVIVVTMIRTGSSWPGRVDQIMQDAKSPSAVPASPPVTMVMPSPPTRFWTCAVPGAMTYWISITELIGTMFQSRLA
jgi:hypothetical protein